MLHLGPARRPSCLPGQTRLLRCWSSHETTYTPRFRAECPRYPARRSRMAGNPACLAVRGARHRLGVDGSSHQWRSGRAVGGDSRHPCHPHIGGARTLWTAPSWRRRLSVLHPAGSRRHLGPDDRVQFCSIGPPSSNSARSSPHGGHLGSDHLSTVGSASKSAFGCADMRVSLSASPAIRG